MSTVDVLRADALVHTRLPGTPVRLVLLGVGHVGGALAELLRRPDQAQQFSVESGLVRDTLRDRPQAANLRLTASVHDALDTEPEIVVEALGGLEPARTLVLRALERRIPVVTANKSLLAAHGDVLFDAAARSGAPLRYEAAVLAGVPFLGTFARRSRARDVTGFCGIVNGTTNFILSKMVDERAPFEAALADAQRLGYAEPDPASDVDGVDAAEKLCVLLRHFGDWSVVPSDLHVSGIRAIESLDLQAAGEFNGAIKPLVFADWRDGDLAAHAGPAFVYDSHPLARITGVQNAVLLRNRTAGELLFAGPGAGPAVTAATLLDDVEEVARTLESPQVVGTPHTAPHDRVWKRAKPATPASEWFVRVSGERLPDDVEIADLLSSYGVWLRRTAGRAADGGEHRWLLTHRCAQSRIAGALRAFGRAAGCRTFGIPVLER